MIVVEAHDIPARDPLLIDPGQTVSVGTRDTERLTRGTELAALRRIVDA